MSDTPVNGRSETTLASPTTNGDAWVELRSLLVGPEQAQLDRLRERLDALRICPEDVSQVLAEAVLLRSNQDRQLTNALLPTVEEALRVSVHKDPRVLVETLFPMIGPAIRKAITTALRSMLESLNRSLEISLSLRGLKWRWEAFRTGKSFAEVVLLHTLRYRVEQVFLIHRETGLLLQHVAAEETLAQDGELVSGMLTAIQDFMRDSFGGTEGETLGTVEYGDRTMWVEQGPQAILAAVVQGNAPQELRTVFEEALESVHFAMHDALASFQGDTSPFVTIRHHLEGCLQQQLKPEEAHRSARGVWGIVALLLLALGAWGYGTLREQQRWTACLQALRDQPGIVVLSTEARRGTYVLTGLRDPLAQEPLDVPAVAQACVGITVSRQWHTYYALHPIFVEERARAALAPPPTVALQLDQQGVLHATGTAPYQWIVDAQKVARALPGVAQFQTDQLVIVDSPEQILARARAALAPPDTVTLSLEHDVLSVSGAATHAWILEARKRARSLAGISRLREEQLVDTTLKELTVFKDQVEKYTLRFNTGTTQPSPGQENVLPQMGLAIRRLIEAAHDVGYRVAIDVIGHTDRTGSVEENLKLGQARADYVLAALRAQGLPEVKMTASGAGWRQPLLGEMTDQDRALNRRVSLRVTLIDTAEE